MAFESLVGYGGSTPIRQEETNRFAGATAMGAMAGPYGALAGAGLEFAGNLMAANAGTSIRTKRRRGRFALDQARSRDAVFSGLENAQLMSGQMAQKQGFAGARSALDLGRLGAAGTIQQQGAQNVADLEQSIVTSGLNSTSPGVQQVAGAQDRTTSMLSNLELQFAQALADLNLEEGNMGMQHGLQRQALAARNRDYERSLGEANYQLLTL